MGRRAERTNMATTNNTRRSTENKALSNKKAETYTNNQPRMGAKTQRCAEAAPWIGEDTVLDSAFVYDMTTEAPSDMQSRLRAEADVDPVNREREVKRIPTSWGSALKSKKTVVTGYMATPDEGEHKVRTFVGDGRDDYPKFFDATDTYSAFMVLLLEDVKTHKRWEAAVKQSEVGRFQQDIADMNAGLGTNDTLEELLNRLTKHEFRVWTLIDPYKVEKYQNRTFFSAGQYTKVYNAIHKKMDEEKKKSDNA